MAALWRSHWFWFALLMTFVSTADYFDHILRPDAPFGDRPWDWLGFTAASHVSFLLAAYGLALALKRLPVPSLATDTAAIAVAVVIHLKLTGPFWTAVFWPEGTMHFDAIWLPMGIAALTYLIFRAMFVLIRMAYEQFRA